MNLGHDKEVFEHVLRLFQSSSKVRVFSRKHKTKSTYIEASIGSIRSQKLVAQYFLEYPLQTKKQQAFLKWYQLYLYRTNSLPLPTLPDKKLIIKMKHHVKTMNGTLKDEKELKI